MTLLKVQEDAIARANAKIRPAMKLYEERNKLTFIIYRLELRDLERLNGILARLSDADIKQVAAYAEGLAEWSSPDSSSGDDAGRPGSTDGR